MSSNNTRQNAIPRKLQYDDLIDNMPQESKSVHGGFDEPSLKTIATQSSITDTSEGNLNAVCYYYIIRYVFTEINVLLLH